MMSKAVEYACNALTEVMGAVSGERLIVVCDDEREEVGWAFAQAGLKTELYTRLIVLKTEPAAFRRELPPSLVESLVSGKPDLTINCLRGPAEETPFRIKLIDLQTRNKTTRLGHGPGITMNMLTEGALALSREEYREMDERADRIVASAEDAREILLSTPRGTELKLSIAGRGFFKDTTITRDKWGNLPTGEVMVGPVENSLEGRLVCDAAIGGISLVEKPLEIHCEHGRAARIKCTDERTLAKVKEALSTDKMASIVGEMAIGLNPKARLVKEFLEAEKTLRTAHIAFGRNIDYPTGGKNNSANHMDFLMREPSVAAVFQDGRKLNLVADGEIVV